MYELTKWTDWDYTRLNEIEIKKTSGRNVHEYADVICMLDTETSKEKENPVIEDVEHNGTPKLQPVENYIVAWTLSLRKPSTRKQEGENLVTLYGSRPDECVECIRKIKEFFEAADLIIYVHFLSYDWTFLRQFFFRNKAFGYPKSQLNTKSHYPVKITWPNGLVLRDSLILAQRSLEKWADDLNVEHKKAAGKWDYDKIRDQSGNYTPDELEYIEHDTLAGVECIDAHRMACNKTIASLYMTATGMPREGVQKASYRQRAKQMFAKVTPTEWTEQQILEQVYHGGYTHADRHFIDYVMDTEELIAFGYDDDPVIRCADFASSYPYCMLAEKYPMTSFTPFKNCPCTEILKHAENWAFYFKLVATNVELKDGYDMPALQHSKCVKAFNSIQDNGRIIAADYVEIYLTELDLEIIYEQYEMKSLCVEVKTAKKGYLPKWFRDYVFQLFRDKTQLKGGDPVLYAIAKAKLNSLYGLTVQKPLQDLTMEIYEDDQYFKGSKAGDYYDVEKILMIRALMENAGEDPGKCELTSDETKSEEERWENYKNSYSKVLPYAWGVWTTAYAFRNVFKLGACYDLWLYTDTDSAYGAGLDFNALKRYNKNVKEKVVAAGYGPVEHNGREYWLGVAEHDEEDDVFSEFVTLGAKRYACRNAKTGKLKITVAGVPKKAGVQCLHDDIRNFTDGLIFDGATTGKKTHMYINKGSIETKHGILYGDSIDLIPCDYKLSKIRVMDPKNLEEKLIIRTYEE